MSRAIAVLRPEPGNRVTAAAIEARGRRAIRLPLFEMRQLDWRAPDPATFDALLLTSANAVRHAGPELFTLLDLPVHAVGEVTAEAARNRGFHIASIGQAGAAALLAQAEAMGVRHALHLAGRDRMIDEGGIVGQVIPVYSSDAVIVPEEAVLPLRGAVALIQSARAGARLAEMIDPARRASIALVAVSARAAQAAGSGWEQVVVPDTPDSDALIDAAIALAD